MKINIIGDIAGRFDEMQELIAKMPQADLLIAVGDLMDRGPKSKQVIEYFMNTPKTLAIYGNHEDMMVEAYSNNTWSHWVYNGGGTTVRSYAPTPDTTLTLSLIDPTHVEWLKTLPIYYETDDLFISHAPITSLAYIPTNPYGRDCHFIWNRNEPRKPQHKFLVNGHNGQLRQYKFGDGSVIGMCIDDSHNRRLVGMHWPTKEIFSVDEELPPTLPED